MKQQSLHFQSSEEFQNFVSQLWSAEYPDYQSVEGSGGDGGFDGIRSTTAYQMYYPDPKNRTDKNYIHKIDIDLAKIITTKNKLNLTITDWILVVPDDLRIGVIAHLQSKSAETGIKCIYYGAMKLEEMVNKHPHIRDSFPSIFLPPVREGLKNLEDAVTNNQRPKVLSTVEVIGDDEYQSQRQSLISEYQQKARGFQIRFGDSSAVQAADQIAHGELNVKLRALQQKKDKSDKSYQLDLDEIESAQQTEITKINNDMAKRGIFQSGIRLKAVGEAEIKWKREIDRLNLKYGKKPKAE